MADQREKAPLISRVLNPGRQHPVPMCAPFPLHGPSCPLYAHNVYVMMGNELHQFLPGGTCQTSSIPGQKPSLVQGSSVERPGAVVPCRWYCLCVEVSSVLSCSFVWCSFLSGAPLPRWGLQVALPQVYFGGNSCGSPLPPAVGLEKPSPLVSLEPRSFSPSHRGSLPDLGPGCSSDGRTRHRTAAARHTPRGAA